MIHLGFNVYLSPGARQNSFLINCLKPAIDEAKNLTHCIDCFYTRFDARGPHLMIFVSVPRASAQEISESLSHRIHSFVGSHVSGEFLRADQREQLHAACRGKTLCAVDREPGFAEEGSVHTFEQSDNDYPFFFSRNRRENDEIWQLFALQSDWAIKELYRVYPRSATGSAVRLMSFVDRHLSEIHPSPSDYWQYHACTLLPDLPNRLVTEEEAVYRALPAAVGGKNRLQFERIWQDAQIAPPPWEGLFRLIELCVQGATESSKRWALLREIIHISFMQLGVAVPFQIPLVLFCWERSLPLNKTKPLRAT